MEEEGVRESEGKWERGNREGKGKRRGRWKEESLRKVGRTLRRTDARTY